METNLNEIDYGPVVVHGRVLIYFNWQKRAITPKHYILFSAVRYEIHTTR